MDFSEIGISGYYYDLAPSGGKLRLKSEDFYVEEKFENIERKEEGNVLVLKIKAINWEHNRLIRFIARSNHVSPGRVYFAGTKDRRSVKVQYFSIPGIKYREFFLNDVDILDHFYLDSPLTIGSHKSNSFVIKVSDCDLDVFTSNCKKISELGIVPNFYGPQRFGALRPVTHLVGREMVRGNYKEAVMLFLGYPGEDRFADIRRQFYKLPDPIKGLEIFPLSLDLERKVLEHLASQQEDYSGAIKELPDNLVSMFIHAYQGFIFNKIVSKRLKLAKSLLPGDLFHINDELIRVNNLNLDRVNSLFERGEGSPTGLVVGYDTELAGGKMGEIEEEVLVQEGIKQSDFKIPFGLSSKGERRDLFLRFSDFGFSDMEVRFSLPPGGYATSVLREIMRVEDMANY
ncbi:MAG: tRNA pseudouridine(13) synthase TruD [Thermoplasmatales archaeon]